MKIETVKIISKNEDGFVIINKEDFDEKTQKLFKKAPVKRTRQKKEE